VSANHRTTEFGGAETLLHNVLESSTEYSIIAADPEGKVLLWNEGARRIYGYAPEEIIGKDSRILHPPDDVASGKVDQLLQSAVTAGKWEGVMRRMRRSGEVFPARVVCTLLRNDAGEQLGFLIVSKDITEEERLRQKLIESEEYSRSLFESSVDAMLITDTNGIITNVNKRVEDLSGRTREQLIGSPLGMYFTDPDRAGDVIRRVLTQEKVSNFELTLRSAKGDERIAALNAAAFRAPDGTVRGVFAAARDVTEQKTLENELREAQSYTRGLIEASLDALVTVDREGRITDVNRQMELATSSERDELVGSPFDRYFTEPGRATEAIRQTFERGQVRNFQLVLKPGTGGPRFVALNASVFRDPQGEVRGTVALARDITDQRTVEEQLRETQQYNRALIEASADAMVIADRNFRVTDVNAQMVAMTGRTRAQLIGSPFADHFTDPARATLGAKTTLESGSLSNFELVLRSRGGTNTWVAVNASVFRGSDGRVKGIFTSARDITDQRRIDAQLRESENYTRGLIEGNLDGLMATDPEGVITDVNKQMESLTGLARDELIGTPFHQYFTDPSKAEAGIRHVLQEQRIRDFELTVRTPQGVETDVSYNATTYRDAEGHPRGVIAAARDITEQKRLRGQLEDRNRELEIQNRRVEQANLLKSMFLANMSHELRTPLNSIIGFSDFLLSEEGIASNPQHAEYLQDILNSGNHLLELINDVLDLAKVESGKMELSVEEFSPRQAVEEVCSVVKRLVSEKHLTLRSEVAPEIRVVRLDPLRFKQILYNLLSNAVKFTNEGGRVTISVRPHDATRFVLAVEDTGIGIRPEDIPRLFREFEQLDIGAGRRYPGSGLGLSLTKKLVEIHGGSIDIASTVGAGSTFTVILPYTVDPPVDRSAKPPVGAG
jgi:PAS domain S-box-containing protein